MKEEGAEGGKERDRRACLRTLRPYRRGIAATLCNAAAPLSDGGFAKRCSIYNAFGIRKDLSGTETFRKSREKRVLGRKRAKQTQSRGSFREDGGVQSVPVGAKYTSLDKKYRF